MAVAQAARHCRIVRSLLCLRCYSTACCFVTIPSLFRHHRIVPRSNAQLSVWSRDVAVAPASGAECGASAGQKFGPRSRSVRSACSTGRGRRALAGVQAPSQRHTRRPTRHATSFLAFGITLYLSHPPVAVFACPGPTSGECLRPSFYPRHLHHGVVLDRCDSHGRRYGLMRWSRDAQSGGCGCAWGHGRGRGWSGQRVSGAGLELVAKRVRTRVATSNN